MNSTASRTLLLIGLWLLLMATTLATRTYFPIDETRYVGVAWEMWLRGNFLVPHLNGEPYSHKPPLLFWLFQAGWWLFGVSDWWPRLVPALFALANLFLTAGLARRLWPELREAAALTPLILFGTLLWTFYTSMVMFDMLVVFCTLLGMHGTLSAADGRQRGWLLLGAAIGLGVLAKGPVILLHTLPVALLAPLWLSVDAKPARWTAWYLGLVGAVLLGAAIGFAWALPAASAGGEVFGRALLWGQTAGRIGGEAAPHSRPLWWYLPILPLMLFPWSVWPPLWRGARALRAVGLDSGVRFCLAWLLPVFIAFSLIRGKQVQYLLPLLPACALLAARILSHAADFRPLRDAPIPGAILTIAGIILTVVHSIAYRYNEADWLEHLEPAWGVAVIALGVAILVVSCRTPRGAVIKWLLVSVLLYVIVHVGIVKVAMQAYDLRPMARHIATVQQQGLPVAHVGKYHNQYHFLGRLEQPLIILNRDEVDAWARRHPRGRVVVYYDKWRPEQARHSEFAQPYRGRGLALWNCAVLREHPEWLHEWPEVNP